MKNQFAIKIELSKFQSVRNSLFLDQQALRCSLEAAKKIKHIPVDEKFFGSYLDRRVQAVNKWAMSGPDLIRAALGEMRREIKAVRYPTCTLAHKGTGIQEAFIFVSSHDLKNHIISYKAQILQRIKDERAERKRIATQVATAYLSSSDRVTYERSGNMMTPGTIKRLGSRKKLKRLAETKRPKDMSNHVGIELEFFSEVNKDNLSQLLIDAGLQDNVQLKSDASIRPEKQNQNPYEISLICVESERKDKIAALCDVLSEIKAKVNKSCGFHVHVDMRSRDKEKSFSNLVSAQGFLYAMNPKSRMESQYCKRTKSKLLNQELDSGTRYKGVNAQALRKFNTIEIRIHSGTVDQTKINNWVDILISIVDAQVGFKRSPRTLETFCREYKISEQLKSYISERMNRFNNAFSNVDEEDYQNAG